MRHTQICRNCILTALAVILLQTLPAWSEKTTGKPSQPPRTYQGPDGGRIDCGNKGPVDKYTREQDGKIRNLKAEKEKLTDRKGRWEKTLGKATKDHDEAVKAIRELDDKAAKRGESGPDRSLARHDWGVKRDEAFKRQESASNTLKGIEDDIKKTAAEMVDRAKLKEDALNSYKSCSCDRGDKWDPNAGKAGGCVCDPHDPQADGNVLPCGR